MKKNISKCFWVLLMIAGCLCCWALFGRYFYEVGLKDSDHQSWQRDWDNWYEGYETGKIYGALEGKKEELERSKAEIDEFKKTAVLAALNSDSILESREDYPILVIESDEKYWKVTRHKKMPGFTKNAVILDQNALMGMESKVKYFESHIEMQSAPGTYTCPAGQMVSNLVGTETTAKTETHGV